MFLPTINGKRGDRVITCRLLQLYYYWLVHIVNVTAKRFGWTARDWRGHDWKQVWNGIRYATSHRVFFTFFVPNFSLLSARPDEKKNRRVQLRIKRIGHSEANSRKLRVIMARPKHSTFWLSLYLYRKEANEIKVNLRYASLSIRNKFFNRKSSR